jgi:type II secretory pathway pseudopilin PulG
MNARPSTHDSGFSLLEAIIAAALVLIITLGIMPLFTRSIVDNLAGKESTLSTNYSRSRSESLTSLPLDREVLRPPVGEDSQGVCEQYHSASGWTTFTCGAGVSGTPPWLRTTGVQQYSIRDIYDDDTAEGLPTFTEPIPGYALDDDRFDAFVHVRELMVVTEGQRLANSPLGRGRRVDLVHLRGF